MELQRPNPEDILESLKQEEGKERRGKLKIFFGFAAGVGKTYAMLKAAHKLKKDGKDVILGYIEPHSRPATMKLAEGLETAPVRRMEYNGIKLREMDLDAILKRKPQVVLVDEYAHTNAAGSRHEKRYQDVEEILNAGINVFTTVNVQHIESLCDIVASITGIFMKERIPDRAFDMADEVQLVDVEPAELITRLEEGKIYRKEQAARALSNFFTEEKLTALREIALRRTADRVNRTIEKAKRQSGNEYFTEERILVGLSPSPSNPKIIRAASRMAQAFGGSLIGLFVETSNFENSSAEDKKRLKDNIHLAEQLGAKIDTVCGEDIPFMIAEYAKSSGISKIVAGRRNTKKGIWNKPSFTDRLTMQAPNMDIYIIPDSNLKKMNPKIKVDRLGKLTMKAALESVAIFSIATATGFCFYYLGFSDTNIITVYILAVMISAILTTNRLLAVCQSFLSVLVFNYFFTDPRFSLQTYASGYPVTFLITFLAAFISGSLALKLKTQARELAKSAYRTKVMLDTNQLLQKENDIDGLGRIMAMQLSKILNRTIVYYQRNGLRLMAPVIYNEEGIVKAENNLITDSEKAVAEWVFKNNKRAGVTTGALGSAACYYLAIRNLEKVYGVVGIEMKQGEVLDAFENNVLFAILSEAAAAMEKEVLRLKEEKAAEEANIEKLCANLLRSISHDLRTPLTSISGNADMLLKNDLNEDKKKEVYSYIYEDAMWLINLVENLLFVTRIEEGSMKIKQQAELLEDIINEALKHINRRSSEYHITVDMEDEMQFVKVDSRLILQVIINIMDNALKYTPAGSDIAISTKKVNHMVRIDIADNGMGIPDQMKPHIFDMFYTAGEKIVDSKRSLGLGLTLCKSIITAHNGTIMALDNKPQGAVFRFTLPAEEIIIHE